MTVVPAFHTSTEEDHPVWHDNDQCIEGKKIKAENYVLGVNGDKCDICIELDEPSPKLLFK